MPTKTPAKKSTPKKTATKTAVKKPAAKSTATRKSASAATTRKKTTAKKPAAMQSFKVYRSGSEFTSLKPTRQTVYWIIILGIITVAQLFILKIQLEIIELTQPLVY